MLRRNLVSPIALFLAKSPKFRKRVGDWITHQEGGFMYSGSLRVILKKYYAVHAGPYSYGPCLSPGALPRGTSIGNYCSFAGNIRVFRRNHPVERASQHPAFYNHLLGYLSEDSIHVDEDNPLTIGNDVWIGQNVIIAPRCKTIGDGAIIAAGAIVSANVPAFAIVGGIPAKHIKWRFSEEIQRELSLLRWWDRDLDELSPLMPLFTQELTMDVLSQLTIKLTSLGR